MKEHPLLERGKDIDVFDIFLTHLRAPEVVYRMGRLEFQSANGARYESQGQA
jgi:hypothetical protein